MPEFAEPDFKEPEPEFAPIDLPEPEIPAFDLPEPEPEPEPFETYAAPLIEDEPFLEETPEAVAESAAESVVAEMTYDSESAANELGLPQDVVKELIGDFIDHANSSKTGLEEAVATAQSTLWQAQAVQMKGIADNLRMTEIAVTLKALEAASDPTDAQSALDTLYAQIRQL